MSTGSQEVALWRRVDFQRSVLRRLTAEDPAVPSVQTELRILTRQGGSLSVALSPITSCRLDTPTSRLVAYSVHRANNPPRWRCVRRGLPSGGDEQNDGASTRWLRAGTGGCCISRHAYDQLSSDIVEAIDRPF
jgi:hypothetical protein